VLRFASWRVQPARIENFATCPVKISVPAPPEAPLSPPEEMTPLK
jgi:hypothetical protein